MGNLKGVQPMSGMPYVLTGTVGTVAATLSFINADSEVSVTTSIQIENMDAAALLYVSFDGGTIWLTIQPNNDSLSIDCNIKNCKLKSSTGTISYQCVYTIVGDPA